MTRDDLINKDAVSRKGLLKSWEELSPRGRTEFDQVIMTIPATTSAEAVQGEWITIDTEVTSVPVYWNEEQRQSDERSSGILEKCECSVCGWKTNFMGHKKLGVNKSYNFCPNCGADMRNKVI